MAILPGRRSSTRADGQSALRNVLRWPVRVLLLALVLSGIGAIPMAPAFAATQASQATQATHQAHQTHQVTHTIAQVTPAAPGGVCQVPGIGDIAGLTGLCNSGSSGIVGALNNICQPSLPQPEQATGGIDAMIQPPAAAAGGKTLYDNYGINGQYWAAHGLQCSDMTSLIGNNVAGMVFDVAKSLDRVTITVYQSAAGDNILTWLRNAVDGLISALGNAIYFPYLAPVVILGAIWLAWQGLIRKRATRTIEGTLWMVVACAAAIALIGKPAMFTGVGTTVSNGATQVLNTAFAKLPAPAGSNCLPVAAGDPQSVTANYAFSSANGLVDQNANELWSVLVCKPWLDGELGTTQYTGNATTGTLVDKYGRQLLWSQAYAANETPTVALGQAKQSTYAGIASAIQQSDPAAYSLFQGNQWTTRLEIAFAAVFASLVAGLLILLIALTLIVLKIGFLLLLVVGPVFLIVGTHPGFGRVIAIRWFEMLVGVLMKQVAIAVVLSVLLYCYSLIMGTADSVLPWALKILMIALVSVAVFIYRKPFQHLFSAVGYGTIGSEARAEYSLREAGATFRRSTLDAATGAIPGVAGYRAARWARRNPGQAAALAGAASAGTRARAGAPGTTAPADGTAAASEGYPARFRPEPPADPESETAGGTRRIAGGTPSVRRPPAADPAAGTGRPAPPLDLPPRSATRTAASTRSTTSTSSPSAPRSTTSPASPGSPTNPARITSTPATPGGSIWSRGAGRSAAAAASSTSSATGRVRATSSGGPRSPKAPANGNGHGNGSAPAWPASGWSGPTTRQRSAPAPKPQSAAPPSQGGTPSQGTPSQGTPSKDKQPATPFWLRPRRRDK